MDGLYSIHEGGMDPRLHDGEEMNTHELEIIFNAGVHMAAFIVPCMIASWIICEAIEFMKPWRL